MGICGKQSIKEKQLIVQIPWQEAVLSRQERCKVVLQVSLKELMPVKSGKEAKVFFDHFSQAKLFFNSQSEPEKNHIIDALCFELGKVETIAIRERMLYFLSQIDEGLAAAVAYESVSCS